MTKKLNDLNPAEKRLMDVLAAIRGGSELTIARDPETGEIVLLIDNPNYHPEKDNRKRLISFVEAT